MKVVVATPYSEGSILAIARAAAAMESLEALFTGGLHRQLERLLPVRRSGDVLGVPQDRIKRRGGGAELARGLLARTAGMEALGSRVMYAEKMAFDRTVARELPAADVVIGIYASCALTLARARQRGSLTVLNFVNSHPADHNRFLQDLSGLRAGSHEVISVHVAARVERELSLADLVLVPSGFVAGQLVGRVPPSTRIAVIPYGVDLTAFTAPPSRPASAFVRCLFVGQISHRKGIAILLDAARQLRDVEFLLTGPIVSRTVLRGRPRNVTLIGTMPQSAISLLMRESDIFVLPSVEDSYGLVVLEAMASGLPVVVTDHVGASELIEPGVAGVVVPAGDADALASAIRRLADDQDLRSRMGLAARDRAVAGQSWASYGSDVLANIADLMTAPSRNRSR